MTASILRRVAALTALAALPFPVLAQRPAIAPPHDSVVHAVVALVQNGDAAARGTFLARALTTRARGADSARSDRLITRLHAQGAPYELMSIAPLGRHGIAKLRSARAGRVVALQVSTDRDDPTGLAGVDILEAHAAVLDSVRWPDAPPASDAAAVTVAARNLARLADAGAFSGTVYVARGDSVLLARGYGLADREHRVPNGVRTRFSIASMGKMFTAVAVLQLVDAGRFALDDTLARVLPAYPNAERASRITIRQLLEHSAGLGDMWSTPRRPVAGLTGALGYAAAVAYPPLLFEPGTRWAYSNEGYAVLAAVVEHASGEEFRAYLRKHVLAPAGMTETSLDGGADDLVPDRAVGYRPRADDPLGVEPPRANWTFVGTGGSGGAGGGYSTVGDLARFGRALRAGKLIPPALRDAMWTGRWDVSGYPGERYGLGSFVGRVGDRVAVGHGGGGGGSGMDNGFRHFTDGSYTIVVLSNMEPPTATDLTTRLVRLFGARPVTASASPTPRGSRPPLVPRTTRPGRSRA